MMFLSPQQEKLVTITIPPVPLGCWIATGGLLWYVLAAVIMRYTFPQPERGWHCNECLPQPAMFFAWVFSPVVYPLLLVGLVVVWFTRKVLIRTRKSRHG